MKRKIKKKIFTATSLFRVGQLITILYNCWCSKVIHEGIK